jgi:dihydrofolate synthase/folylpolyglutamate synthase
MSDEFRLPAAPSWARGSEFALYRETNRYLEEELIRIAPPPDPEGRSRREWMESFLLRLGDPQRAFRAIHVAGTSGKGSIAIMIAETLRAAGIHTGLHVSPYLQVATEKLWVDGAYASARELAALVSWIRPHVEACRGALVPIHGMAQVAIALEHFRRAGVELAVIETGVGGRDDFTNVLATAVAVISAVGLDHLQTLGPTLADVAWHKAGIIRAGSRAVALAGPGAVAAEHQARAVGAPLRVLASSEIVARPAAAGRVAVDYRGPRLAAREVPLAMAGAFQAANAGLAIAALEALADPRVDERALRAGLARARLPGRLELLPAEHGSCPVLLDGAHNPDKLAALAAALPALLGDRGGRALSVIAPLRACAFGSRAFGASPSALHVVYGALASHAGDDEGPRRLAELARTFVATEPRVHAKPARPAAELARAVAGCGAEIRVECGPRAALDVARAAAAPEDVVLVTGSLYLCGELRGRWYPPARVLEARTSWP